ncbi:MAG: tetratricopeptide repeat protein [Planctomycetota bacterium]
MAARLLLPLCIVLAAVSPLSARDQEPTAVDYALRAAEDLIAAGRSDQALGSLTRLRAKEKSDARIPFLMAQCEYNLWRADRKDEERLKRARKHILAAFRLKYPYPECSFFAGLLEFDAKNWEDAEIGFRAAIAGRFRMPVARENLALALYHRGVEMAKEAEDELGVANVAILVFLDARDRLRELAQDTRLLPDRREFFRVHWLTAWSNLAAMHQKAGNYPAAIMEVEALRKVDPENPHHCHNLGLMYGEMGEWEKAVEWYGKALKLGAKDGFVEPHLRLAHIWSKRHDREKAERHFEKFFEKFPNDWEAHYERGEHYRRFKEYEKAIADFLRCYELDPEAYIPLKSLSESYRLNGQAEKAAEWLEKFKVLDEKKNRETAPPQPDEEKPAK